MTTVLQVDWANDDFITEYHVQSIWLNNHYWTAIQIKQLFCI